MKAGTIILTAAALLFVAKCHKERKNDKPKFFFRKKLVNNYNGYCLFPFGIFIKESERNNKNLIEHELVHWKQFQREGFFKFLANYSHEAVTKGYDKNKYEIEARTCEDDYCKHNYTECVRTGRAKTVYNPNFRKLAKKHAA